jgi:hypothetical protein
MAVYWIASEIFRVPPAQGTLSVLQLPDPSVLLVLILGGIRRRLIGRHVHEYFIIVLGTRLIVIRVAKEGHVDLTIQRVVSRMAVLE